MQVRGDQLFQTRIAKVLNFILNEGFSLVLLGGAVRTFLLSGEKSKDLDFEIRSINKVNHKEWEAKLDHLMNALEQKFTLKVKKETFFVYKIYVDDYDLEISSPRIENYSDRNNFGHGEFDIQIDGNLDYKRACARRDFTINSCGFEIKSDGGCELVDPYSGVADLKDKVLKTANNDFYKDPVRFLRAIRFSLKLDFVLAPDLVNEVKKNNLEQLTTYYFYKECFVSGVFFQMVHTFFLWSSKYNINMNENIKKLKILDQKSFRNFNSIFCQMDLVLVLIFFSDIRNWQELNLSISLKKICYLGDWAHKLKSLESDQVKEGLKLINDSSSPFELESYNLIEDVLYLRRNWDRLAGQHKKIEYFILQFSQLKKLFVIFKRFKLEGSLQGKEEFQNFLAANSALLKERKEEQRYIQIYFHLKKSSKMYLNKI